MRVLVVNAGSSTLKLRVVAANDELENSVELQAPDGRFDDDELAAAMDRAGAVDAVGHRVVHGGERFVDPTVVTPEVEAALDELGILAPLHQPPALAAIRKVREARPELPAVACFDTAFHATLPRHASTYAVAAEWRDRWPIRRYGFHGLSHRWASRRAAEMCGFSRADVPDAFRLVTCHLGAGASLAAVAGDRCVDTTMGFTPLEGVVMATRSGSVDPGLVLWLLGEGRLPSDAVSEGLWHASGLRGLCGTGDMRDVLGRAADGDGDALLALDVYVHSVCAHVAAMAASLEGLDALVFTGGVGENAGDVRRAVADRLGWLGVAIDVQRNAAAPDAEITAEGSTVRTFVVEAREELVIAHDTREVLGHV